MPRIKYSQAIACEEKKVVADSVLLIHYTDGESTAIGPEASSLDKREEKEIKKEKPEPEEPQKNPSSEASEKQPKRSSPAKEDKQNDSESETLHLPGIRPQSVACSIKSPYFSFVKVVTPKGELGGHIEILT